jgi:exopolysaccharide production protein ExoQ
MIFVAYLPEIVAFLQFVMMSVQETPFGPILVACQLALFGMLALARPQDLLQTVIRWWPLMLLQLLALTSSFWSSVPDMTARYAAQALYTTLSALFLARLLGARRFLIILTTSAFTFCVLSLFYGRQGTSFHNMVLIGLTGSKNQMAFEALMLLMAAISTLMLSNLSKLIRWIALLSVPFAAFLLLTTESSTALVLGLVGSLAIIACRFAERMSPSGRIGMVLMFAAVLTPMTLLLPEINASVDHFMFDTLNKDPTLTGRTQLWDRADDLIARKPFLGWGYQAIWMGDSEDTIALRRLTNVQDGRLFNFHQQWRQIGVDTGIVGILIYALTSIAGIFAGFRQFLLRPSVPTSFFFISLTLLVARSFVEILMAPFSIHAIVYYAACLFAFAPGMVEAPAPQLQRPAPPLRGPLAQVRMRSRLRGG